MRALAVLWTATALAAGPEAWTPLRWQGGPLETSRREKTEAPPLGAAVRKTIETWYDPQTLELLRDTPFNCLLVTWSAGAPAGVEKQQRDLVTAYAREAQKRGFSVLGLVQDAGDPAAAARDAESAGLNGLALDGDEVLARAAAIRDMSIPLVALAPRNRLRGRGISGVVAVQEGVWPGVRTEQGGAVVATPSAEPWIDSNTWLLHSVRAWTDKPVWLDYEPDSPQAADYPRAVADAAAGGGRWIVSLDANFRDGLRRGSPEAAAAWRRIVETAAFYEDHADWRTWPADGPVVIVQDPGYVHADMSDETLNLIARRQISYRIVERSRLTRNLLAASRAAVATGIGTPTDAEREMLTAFAANGGIVFGGPAWGKAGTDSETYFSRTIGRGELIAYKEEPPEQEGLSKDVRDFLLSDVPVKLFNAPSVLFTFAAEPGGRRLLIHLVNYAAQASEGATLKVRGRVSAAKIFAPAAPPAPMKVDYSDGTAEITLPRIGAAAAIVLDLSSKGG